MAAFGGWPEDYQRFFIGLELDNSKRYFEANRKVYLASIKGPMEALLADLEPEFGPGRITRPNRDTRFAKDKSPYKTNIYATAARGGYVALDAKGFTAAGGSYMLEPEQLAAFRTAVAADGSGEQLVGIVAELERKGYEIGGEELKRAPAGFPPDHPRVRLLRHKRLYYWRNFGLQPWLGSSKAVGHVAQVWRDGGPLQAWFEANVSS